MARIRTIKPEFFTSLTVAGLPVEARLTFIGLWTYADDEGRGVYDPRLVKAAVWPLDDRTAADVEKDLQALTEASLITHYEVAGRQYFVIRSWQEHQKINRPTKSKLPDVEDREHPPPTSGNTPSVNTHGELSEDALKAHGGKGKERNRERKGTPPSAATRARTREAPPAATVTHLPRRTDHEPPHSDREPAEAGTAERILTGWHTQLPRPPARRTVEALGREIVQMLADRVDPADISRGLDEWQQANASGRAVGPSALASFVHAVTSRATPTATTGPARPSTTDQRVAAGAALVEKYRALEAGS